MTGSLAAAYRASRQENTGERIPVDVVDLDELGAQLDKLAAGAEDAPADEEAATAAAIRVLQFAAKENSAPYLEHFARIADGFEQMSDNEFHVWWFRSVLDTTDWGWIRDQFVRYGAVWDNAAREDLRKQVMHLQIGRPTQPPAGSDSVPSGSGGDSNSDTDTGASPE